MPPKTSASAGWSRSSPSSTTSPRHPTHSTASTASTSTTAAQTARTAPNAPNTPTPPKRRVRPARPAARMAEPAPGRPARSSSPASDVAMSLLRAFIDAGIRDVVVAPGSRSQALALAAAELERVGAVRLHVRIDERGAAFLALGLAIESRRPTVVITTSGTAVANLHPAVLEAHHSGVPLVVVSAD